MTRYAEWTPTRTELGAAPRQDGPAVAAAALLASTGYHTALPAPQYVELIGPPTD